MKTKMGAGAISVYGNCAVTINGETSFANNSAGYGGGEWRVVLSTSSGTAISTTAAEICVNFGRTDQRPERTGRSWGIVEAFEETMGHPWHYVFSIPLIVQRTGGINPW